MQSTSKTSIVQSASCKTVFRGAAQRLSGKSATRRQGVAFEIPDEQAAKITQQLQKLVKMVREFNEVVRRFNEVWDEIVRCHAAMIGERDGDSIGPVNCGETRCLSQMQCDDTQISEKQPQRK